MFKAKLFLAFALAALVISAQPFPQSGIGPTRTTITANLVKPSNTNPGIFVNVAATTGCPQSGTFNNVSNPCDLFVGREQMHILAINGLVLTVERGASGTIAEAYPNGTEAFIGSTSAFRDVNFNFVPFPQFGDWFINDQYTFFATIGPLAGETYTQVTDVSGKLWFSGLWVPYSHISTGGCLFNGSGALADKVILALWDRNGVLVANSALAGVTQSGTSAYQCQSWVTPAVLQGPALYFVGVQGNGATAASWTATPAGFAPTNYPTGVQTGGTFGTILPIAAPPTSFTAAVGPIMTIQ